MSVLKPVIKIPRVATNPQTKNVVPAQAQESDAEERNRRTASLPATATSEKDSVEKDTMKHPKGHKSRMLQEVWESMDKNAFLHLTDTTVLMDVWVQPICCEVGRGAFTTVTFKQMVAGRHLKSREASCKMSTIDLMKMLYLNECVQAELQGLPKPEYDVWVNEKTALCVKSKGLEEGNVPAKLCNFILTEDSEFSFYPTFLRGRCGIFFRKVCCHSYKTGVKGETKLDNPCMIKCVATKGQFEYIIEARLFLLPDGWFEEITTPMLSEEQALC